VIVSCFTRKQHCKQTLGGRNEVVSYTCLDRSLHLKLSRQIELKTSSKELSLRLFEVLTERLKREPAEQTHVQAGINLINPEFGS